MYDTAVGGGDIVNFRRVHLHFVPAVDLSIPMAVFLAPHRQLLLSSRLRHRPSRYPLSPALVRLLHPSTEHRASTSPSSPSNTGAIEDEPAELPAAPTTPPNEPQSRTRCAQATFPSLLCIVNALLLFIPTTIGQLLS